MPVRKADLTWSEYKFTSGLYASDGMDKPMNAAALKSWMEKAKPRIGAKGVKVLAAAYAAAKTAAGKTPTRSQVRAQISKAIASLANERAKGRVNDGYVDKREVGLIKGDVAKEIYKVVDSGKLGNNAAPTPAKELALKAPLTKVAAAVKKLELIIDQGFKLYDASNDDDGMGLSNALRKAANDAGLSSSGRAAILTALNGATSRGDGDSGPSASAVKQLLRNAVDKLKASDGAQIVDLANPSKAPVSKKDGVVTGLELDRTPAATGMTSRALLEYAATL